LFGLFGIGEINSVLNVMENSMAASLIKNKYKLNTYGASNVSQPDRRICYCKIIPLIFWRSKHQNRNF